MRLRGGERHRGGALRTEGLAEVRAAAVGGRARRVIATRHQMRQSGLFHRSIGHRGRDSREERGWQRQRLRHRLARLDLLTLAGAGRAGLHKSVKEMGRDPCKVAMELDRARID